uniref:Uncharacterized protein n=1 Tax=Candidatus Kentrum sp. UNK TaxID=2126344 RepID=A0A451ASV1_9GAMM|nr:MAG: hypothetical protein BECKUNK1418G_GA0071005_101731 [Candidatus Kentron sp. UNK]VFK69119.1 MAG: hypothetical protein BECKUNK1418H_GA0071006_101038 [Candidatus Kentron sp. UNK]
MDLFSYFNSRLSLQMDQVLRSLYMPRWSERLLKAFVVERHFPRGVRRAVNVCITMSIVGAYSTPAKPEPKFHCINK